MSTAHSTTDVRARAIGCLKGVATGDAIGKQTETLSFEGVRRCYPAGLCGFEGPPGSPIPRYRSNRKHCWLFGEITDDTEGTIAVARAILQDGEVRHATVGRELLTCRKSVHPGVASLWDFHQAGDPARLARGHNGCGAAIRVAPVGIVYRVTDLERLVTAARESAIPTHGGPLAIAAAAAVAAAVSAAIDAASPPEIVDIACRAATLAERRWCGIDDGRFEALLRTIDAALPREGEIQPSAIASRFFPDGPLTIVPLAIALATHMDSAAAAMLLATNLGGDSDSVASIAGGILGARDPETVNEEWYAATARVNGLDLVSLAEALSARRR